ncbi:MAG: hypothetical protein ACYC7D_11380 [Nitrososphaerales archaeon]
MRLKFVKNAFLMVFRNQKYILSAAALSVILFFIFIIVNNIPFFISSASEWGTNPILLITFVLYLAKMIVSNAGIVALGAIVAVSILVAINISMIIYRIRTKNVMQDSTVNASGRTKRGSFALSVGGIFGGALSSGCPACSATLITLLGVSGGLAVFPMKGLELSFVSIIAVLASLYFVSRSLAMDCKLCK